MTLIHQILAAPVFPGNETRTFRADLIRTSLLVQIVFIMLTFFANLMDAHMPVSVLAVDVIIFATGILFFLLLKTGRVEAAGIGAIVSDILMITIGIMRIGTVRDPSTVAYLLIIIMAGYAFGNPGLALTMIASWLMLTLLVVFEIAGWLPPAHSSVTVTQWTIYSLFFGLGGYLTYIGINNLQRALDRVTHEVGDRRVAEAVLQASERKFRSLIEQSLNGIMMIDGAGRIMVWNRALEELMGNKAAEVVGQYIWQVHLPLLPVEEVTAEGYQQLQHRISHFDTPGKRAIANTFVQKEITLADGSKKHIEYSIYSIEMPDQFWVGGILRDITERQAAVQKLLENERRYHAMFDNHNAVMLLLEPGNGRILDANQSASDYYGYDLATLTSMSIDQINCLPAQQPEQKHPWATAEVNNYFIFPQRLANGELRTVEIYLSPFELNDQTVLYAIIHDITERTRLQAMLVESERRFQLASEGLGYGVWDFDYIQNTVFLLPRWKAMLGYEQNELSDAGDTFMQLVHPEDFARIEKENQEIAEGNLPEFEREVRLRCKDGTYKWILSRGKVVDWTADNKPRRSIGIHNDIDELKRIQAQLRLDEQKLVVMKERERLARDIHDGLGQTLGYLNVQSQATEALIENRQLDAAQTNLRKMAKFASEAMNDLRDHILDLRLPVSQPANFQQALQASLERLTQDSGIRASLSYPSDLPLKPFAPAVEEQVLRIVQEALVNVRKHAQAHKVQVIVSARDHTTQVIVADDGKGFSLDGRSIDPDALRHFGLEMMRERAEQMGGQLEIHAKPGSGTQVILYVPNLLQNTPSGRDFSKIQNLRILLVDDHPLFLEGMHSLLNARGVTVIGSAENGQQALEQARLLRPDVVVMDIQMPVCNGVEAVKRIKAEMPEIKILMLTVSESEDNLYEALRNGASGYLLKSLDANTFCQFLLEMVNGEMPIHPQLAARMLSEFAQKNTYGAETKTDTPLTQRQWEILSLVAEGFYYKEVAKRLSLSEKTIKYHMGQILDRLHLDTREQALAYARRVNKAR